MRLGNIGSCQSREIVSVKENWHWQYPIHFFEIWTEVCTKPGVPESANPCVLMSALGQSSLATTAYPRGFRRPRAITGWMPIMCSPPTVRARRSGRCSGCDANIVPMLATAIDQAGPEREALFRTRRALVLGHELGDIAAFRKAIETALDGLE